MGSIPEKDVVILEFNSETQNQRIYSFDRSIFYDAGVNGEIIKNDVLMEDQLDAKKEVIEMIRRARITSMTTVEHLYDTYKLRDLVKVTKNSFSLTFGMREEFITINLDNGKIFTNMNVSTQGEVLDQLQEWDEYGYMGAYEQYAVEAVRHAFFPEKSKGITENFR